MFNKIINSVTMILKNQAYTNIIINETLQKNSFSDNQKNIYTKIVYGVIENKLLLDYYLQPLISGKRVKPFIKNALRVGAYSIDNLNLANHYIVNEIVDAIKKQDYKASTFVNAILRKYITQPKRSLDTLSKQDYISIKYSINKELVNLLYEQYGDNMLNFVTSCDEIYNTYRINKLKTNQKEVLDYLNENSIDYVIEDDIIIQTKKSLINSKLFIEGKIVAQDKSSIKVGIVASPSKKMNILDACSAPGSKSMHLADIIENDGKITSMDIYPHKIKLIEENAKKLGVTCINTKLDDARKVKFTEQFDLILVDAPCSGLGVIRHKPDLKYNMTLEKINDIIKTQKDILNNIVNYLKKDGSLIYSTCTINQDENEKMIQEFLNNHPNLKKEVEYKILPTNINDGFYICKLKG